MKIAKIETMGMVDGPGIRTIIFTSGCPMRCLYCHNPEMWTFNDDEFYTTDQIINRLEKYRTYYETSGGGVTFSGGEPLMQKELVGILKACKEKNIHTAIDTCGHFLDEQLTHQILENVDLVILDIKHHDEKEYLKLTSQPIKDLIKFINILNTYKKDVWLRSVIVPGINDTEDYIINLIDFIKQIKNVKNIELLGFHNLANDKYENLGIMNPLKDSPSMDSEKLEILKKCLSKHFKM